MEPDGIRTKNTASQPRWETWSLAFWRLRFDISAAWCLTEPQMFRNKWTFWLKLNLFRITVIVKSRHIYLFIFFLFLQIGTKKWTHKCLTNCCRHIFYFLITPKNINIIIRASYEMIRTTWQEIPCSVVCVLVCLFLWGSKSFLVQEKFKARTLVYLKHTSSVQRKCDESWSSYLISQRRHWIPVGQTGLRHHVFGMWKLNGNSIPAE